MTSVREDRANQLPQSTTSTNPEPPPIDVAQLSPAVQAVHRLIRHAYDLGATDLHFEPTADCIQVNMRWNGTLLPLESLHRDLGPAIAGRLKTMAQLRGYRKDIPQEGWIPADGAHTPTDVRVAAYPTVNGERIALRLSGGKNNSLQLDQLGLPESVLTPLVQAFDRKEGVILMAGPSGSGKTSTLYACLEHLASHVELRTILTIEDPVERRIPGVTQTQINRCAGLDFPIALRSVLRQDPDVLLVGEIRDRETAQVTFEAGLTGHLVASTVHAASAPQAFTRLLELGVEPYVLTTAIQGVVAQRLVRRRCTASDCGESNVICMRCKGMGYNGSTLIAEWLPMTESLRQAILASGDSQALISAAEHDPAYANLRVQGDRLVESGVTTREEVDRVLGR